MLRVDDKLFLKGEIHLASKNFQDLIVWQKAMKLVKETYVLVKSLPKEEQYALSDQMRRAAVSIPSNIAEGQGRNTEKEFIQFLHVAKGSNAELMTQILICVDLGYLKQEQVQRALQLNRETGQLLTALIKSLRQKMF